MRLVLDGDIGCRSFLLVRWPSGRCAATMWDCFDFLR